MASGRDIGAPERGGVAVVTGAGGALGLACARRLAARSHSLVLADVDPGRLRTAVNTLRGDGVVPIGLTIDVADERSVAELARVAGERGRLAALVHAAGISRSMADGRRILEVNLIAAARLLRAFLPLAEARSVAICISSVGGYRDSLREFDDLLADPAREDFLSELEERLPLAERSGACYDLSKRGTILLCERAAESWGAHGARIVSVSPGLVETPMGQLESGKSGYTLDALAALRRAGKPEEVAAVVDFLCSDAASYVTGCDLRVDGGAIPGINNHASADVASDWNGIRVEPPPDLATIGQTT